MKASGEPQEQVHLNVSTRAVQVLKRMNNGLAEVNEKLAGQVQELRDVFDANVSGLGHHTEQIHALLDELESTALEADRCCRKLSRKLTRAAAIRQGLIEKNPYHQVSDGSDDLYLPSVLGMIYDDLVRQRLRPKELGPDNGVRGTWDDQAFYASDDFVPGKYNPDKKNFGQIRQELASSYGIQFGAISYAGGYADFAPVAVAQVGLGEIVQTRMNADSRVTIDNVFHDREANFAMADQLTAQRQTPIPDLPSGYTASDLAVWRKKHGFSWDESYQNGYLLVPGVIHGNLAHTGLVAVDARGSDAEEAFAHRYGGTLK